MKKPMTLKAAQEEGAYLVHHRASGALVGKVVREDGHWRAWVAEYEDGKPAFLRRSGPELERRRLAVWEVWIERDPATAPACPKR